MNILSGVPKFALPIDLGAEPAFQLGALRIDPPTRQVISGDQTRTIEPRVMQVLVALVRADGRVVSRDQLIERCWGGRIVGDDAVNSCLAKVRALAVSDGEPAFEIETVPRVGYRLRQGQRGKAKPIPLHAAAPAARPVLGSRVWTGLAVAAIAIVAVAIACYLYLRPEPVWTVAESQQPFISTPAIERYPALAPDGTMIAYSAGPTINNRHIYLRLLKGGDPIELTHDADDASAPAWSPDGRSIAYVIFEAAHPCRIMEIPVPAGQSRQVGQCHVSARSSLAFDPSGRALYFSDAPARGAPDQIVRLDLDNGRVSPVTHPRSGADDDNSPSVSPDGSALLYGRDLGERGNEIRLLRLSNGIDQLVAAFKGDADTSAAWSEDGRTIFLSRSRGNDNSLWAYPVRGGEPWRILATGAYIGRLSAGPNGLLAMEMGFPGGQLVAVAPHSDQPPRPIGDGGLRTWCVDYAPDGTFLATGWQSESWGIWISSPKETLHKLLGLPGPACAIRWSPDGSRFAFVQWGGNEFEVPVMTRGGAPISRLSYPGNDSGRLDWTSDGKSILTSRVEKQGWRIWRTDLATPDKSVPITPFGWLSPRVHGSMVFAEKDGAAGIWRIDGTPHRVTDGPAPEASDVYTIAGDRLIYSDTTDPDHPMFSAESIYGGPKDRLAPLPDGQVNFVFGVDPNSGAIVYTRGLNDTDIGLLRLVKR